MRLRSLFHRAPPQALEFGVKDVGRRPDIVLFVTDEQRHDELGYSSDDYYETPALSALARRGVIFDAAYSGSTTCVPSRASLMTGLAHHRVPLAPRSFALRQGYWTMARALRGVGYQTALIGKMHFFPMYADHGFDTVRLAEHLVPFSGYDAADIDDYHRFLVWQGRASARATHMFGDGRGPDAAEYTAMHSAVKFPFDESLHPIGWIEGEARQVLANRNPEAPLLLVVSFPRPHAPYDPAEPYASLYDPASARVPRGDYSVNEGLSEAFRGAFDRTDRQRHKPQPTSQIPEETLRVVLTYVRALIRQLDQAMGRVLDACDLERSVVFMTSDHGTYAGHRGLIGKVPWIPFEDLARVPFFCAAPGAHGGRRITAPVQSHDLVLTALDYAGIVPPPGVFDSESLRPVLEGKDAPADRPVFSGASMGWPMLRRGNLKLIRRGRLSGGAVLFDLDEDPGETRSVLDEARYRSDAAQLTAELDRHATLPIPLLPDAGEAG